MSETGARNRNLYENQHSVIIVLVDRLGYHLELSVLIGGWATFVRVGGEISLDIDLPYESQLGGKLCLNVEVLAEYPHELSLEKWTLLRLEAHIATKMAALLKLDCVDPALAAEVLARASTVDI